jgi:CubicO group peptidase (beta-lactamase class C family)
MLCLLFVLTVLLGFLSPGLQPAWAAEPSFEQGATAHLKEVTAGDTSGVAVLVARDGKIVFQGGFGLADIEKKTPVTPETKFRIGSVTKQFTAAAMLRLAEAKKLSLDDTLAKYFPDFPKADGVKLRQLLNHTSGLHSYTSKPDFISRVKDPIEPAKLIEWFANDPCDFEPGKSFAYNNSAYFLAGEVIAKVSEKSLGDYLQETFFKPLEMNSTGVYVNSSPPEGVAIGYSYANEKCEPALDWDMSWAGGAGALYSTVGDLYRWNEALYGGKVVSPASLKEMTTPVKLPEGVEGMKYGLGLVMFEVKRLPAIGHGGGLNGWSSDLMRLPEQNCTVVVLSNGLPQPPKINPAAISRALAEKLLAEEIAKLPAPTEDKTVDPKTFAEFVGRYDYQGAVMTVTVEEDKLMAQLTGQPKNQIFPKGKDKFFWKVVDAEVEFVRDDKGQVTAARHSQGGVTFKAAKLGEEKVKLTAEQAQAYVGEYKYGPGAVLTVSRDGTQLFAQMTGQPKFPIFAIGEDEFEWKVVAAKVKFEKDKDGKVTKGIHSQGGGTIEAPKVK